ncbi:MAG TPA: glycosyltransferase family 2 protein [Thermoanaerobaculia bacterium]|nr:glycosyltransferase family 2 protein [Thermoanaerobaculia bacterium]
MSIELSIVMPCLDEAETIGACIAKARRFLETSGIAGEIVVADNGSGDGSRAIAEREGARVVDVPERGYGSALQGGIAAARGRYVIMGDADDSYDFSALAAFVEKLRGGADLVMGDRFAGGVLPGAMPPLHRWLGNPVLSAVGRLFFSSPVRDFHCGLRGFSKAAYERMHLRTTGMEFASEMVVKATLLGMRVDDVPIVLRPDGRSRPPHLRSWRDGWRHLRFLLLYSPRWLFLYPGLLLMFIGALVVGWLLPHPRTVGSVTFDVQTLLYAGMAIVIGFQAALFAIFTKVFAINAGLLPEDRKLQTALRNVTLEGGLIAGALLFLFGLAGSLYAVGIWGEVRFGGLDPSETLRTVIPSVVCLTLGCEIILASFFLSVLGLERK